MALFGACGVGQDQTVGAPSALRRDTKGSKEQETGAVGEFRPLGSLRRGKEWDIVRRTGAFAAPQPFDETCMCCAVVHQCGCGGTSGCTGTCLSAADPAAERCVHSEAWEIDGTNGLPAAPCPLSQGLLTHTRCAGMCRLLPQQGSRGCPPERPPPASRDASLRGSEFSDSMDFRSSGRQVVFGMEARDVFDDAAISTEPTDDGMAAANMDGEDVHRQACGGLLAPCFNL